MLVRWHLYSQSLLWTKSECQMGLHWQGCCDLITSKLQRLGELVYVVDWKYVTYHKMALLLEKNQSSWLHDSKRFTPHWDRSMRKSKRRLTSIQIPLWDTVEIRSCRHFIYTAFVLVNWHLFIEPRLWFQLIFVNIYYAIKMSSYQYRKSWCGDQTLITKLVFSPQAKFLFQSQDSNFMMNYAPWSTLPSNL